MIRKISWLLTLLVALPLGTMFTSARAVSLNVTNPGFEDISGEAPFNEFTFGPLDGWDLYDPGNIADGGDGPTYFIGTLTPFEPDPIGSPGLFANFPDGAAEGQRVGIAFNFEGSGGQGEYGFIQTLADTLEAHSSYTLQVEIGNIATATAMNGTTFELSGFPGYRVDFLAGGVVVAQDNNSLSGIIDDGEFATSTIAFTTGSTHPQLGQPLGIRLVNLNQVDLMFPDSDLEVDFDDVRLNASLAGDFDQDDDVDGFDLLTWQRGYPTLYNASNLVNWEANFGSQAASAAAAHIVPEPATRTLGFGLLQATMLCATRRKRKSR